MQHYLSLEEVLREYNDSEVVQGIEDFQTKFMQSINTKSISDLCDIFGLSCDSISVLSEIADLTQACYLVSMLQAPALSDTTVKGHYLIADMHLFPFQITSVDYCEDCGHYHYGYDCIFVDNEGCGINHFSLDNSVCLTEENLTFHDVYLFLCNNTGIGEVPILV